MTMTSAPVTFGRHAAAPVEEHELDLEMERLVEAGVPSGLPAGLGDNQGTAVRGAHRAEADGTQGSTDGGSHLPWRLLITSVLALLIVLALAFIAVDAMAATWGVGGHVA